MKTETALQQVLTEFNRIHQDGDESEQFSSKHEVLGHLEMSLRVLKDKIQYDHKPTDLRASYKHIAAEAFKAMVDLT